MCVHGHMCAEMNACMYWILNQTVADEPKGQYRRKENGDMQEEEKGGENRSPSALGPQRHQPAPAWTPGWEEGSVGPGHLQRACNSGNSTPLGPGLWGISFSLLCDLFKKTLYFFFFFLNLMFLFQYIRECVLQAGCPRGRSWGGGHPAKLHLHNSDLSLGEPVRTLLLVAASL